MISAAAMSKPHRPAALWIAGLSSVCAVGPNCAVWDIGGES